ncbi:unnamed protein product [Amoebophrya sp. A120]|nr:unnamed protein product [Amoebophrya sp. A120]|eukprot:GSA120T00006998001.1
MKVLTQHRYSLRKLFASGVISLQLLAASKIGVFGLVQHDREEPTSTAPVSATQVSSGSSCRGLQCLERFRPRRNVPHFEAPQDENNQLAPQHEGEAPSARSGRSAALAVPPTLDHEIISSRFFRTAAQSSTLHLVALRRLAGKYLYAVGSNPILQQLVAQGDREVLEKLRDALSGSEIPLELIFPQSRRRSAPASISYKTAFRKLTRDDQENAKADAATLSRIVREQMLSNVKMSGSGRVELVMLSTDSKNYSVGSAAIVGTYSPSCTTRHKNCSCEKILLEFNRNNKLDGQKKITV